MKRDREMGEHTRDKAKRDRQRDGETDTQRWGGVRERQTEERKRTKSEKVTYSFAVC